MKTVLFVFSTLLIPLLSFSQDYKWDIGLKYEKNAYSAMNLEARRHLSKLSLTSELSITSYSNSVFSVAGFHESADQVYYANRLYSGEEYRLDIGVQRPLPLWKDYLFIGLELNGGYYSKSTQIAYYTSDQAEEPYVAGALFDEAPTDNRYDSEGAFWGTGLELGADIPIKNRLILTATTTGGIRQRTNIVQFQFAFAAGLRYRFGQV